MTERRHISSGTPWEARVGYSRAVRVGAFVFVAGTLASDENGVIIGVGSAYVQAMFIIKKIRRALEEAGATLEDVVRTRMYLTDIGLQDEVGRAHAEFFAQVRPASTMVQVGPLAHSDGLVEIEVDAVIASALV